MRFRLVSPRLFSCLGRDVLAKQLGEATVDTVLSRGKPRNLSVQNPASFSGEVGDGKILVYVWWELLENYLVLASVDPQQWLATAFSLMIPPATNFYLSVRTRVMDAQLVPPLRVELRTLALPWPNHGPWPWLYVPAADPGVVGCLSSMSTSDIHSCLRWPRQTPVMPDAQ